MMKSNKRRQINIIIILLILTGCSPVKKNEYASNNTQAKIKTSEASTSKEPMLCFENKGDIGGHIVVEVKGAPHKINAYKKDFHLFFGSEVSKKPEKVKILKTNNKIKQNREANQRRKIKHDREIKKRGIEKRSNKTRLDRKRKINAILVRDCFIRKARKKRNNKLPKNFNPKKDLLIEISLVNAKARSGYISLDFDPRIKRGEKHIYVVDIPGTRYLTISPTRGKLSVFTVNRRNNRILVSRLMKKRGRINIPRKKYISLVVRSVTSISKYSGRITGWIRTK